MKVIDLLNKLYNNEEVPKRIKIGVCYLTLNKNKDNYIYDNSDEYYGDELIHWYDLGMKVEIIDEDKKIEKNNTGLTNGEWHEESVREDILKNKNIEDYLIRVMKEVDAVKFKTFEIIDHINGSDKE